MGLFLGLLCGHLGEAHFTKGRIETFDRQPDLVLADDQWRQEPDGVLTRRHGQYLQLAKRRHHVAGRHGIGKPHPTQEATPPDFGDGIGMAFCRLGQQAAHEVGAAAHILKKTRRRHLVENDFGHRHGQRVAGKGRAMRSGGHRVANSGAGDDRADRKPATKALCHGNDVGHDAGCLVGKQGAGTANARLHLVGDHQRPELISRLANAAKIIVMRVTGTALALNRLDHHRRNMVAKRGTKLVQIAEGNMIKPVRHRAEPGAVGRLVSGRKHAKCPPVERAGGAQDGRAVGLSAFIGGAAGHLHGGFICLGAGIAEIDLIEAGQRRQLFGHPFLARNAVEVRGVPQLASLIAQRVDQPRMRMAKRVHGDAACAVKIALAIISNQPAAIPANEGQIGAAIGFHHRRCRRLGCLRSCHVEFRFFGPSFTGHDLSVCRCGRRVGTGGQSPKNQTTSTSATAPVVSLAASEGCQIRHFRQTCQGVCRAASDPVSPG